MNNLLLILVMVLSVLISSISQAMLKVSANKTYKSKLREYLNPLVVFAYFFFFVSTLVTVYALKYVPLSYSPIIEALGYVFVALLGLLFFKEKIRGKKLVGLLLIITGMLVVTL